MLVSLKGSENHALYFLQAKVGYIWIYLPCLHLLQAMVDVEFDVLREAERSSSGPAKFSLLLFFLATNRCEFLKFQDGWAPIPESKNKNKETIIHHRISENRNNAKDKRFSLLLSVCFSLRLGRQVPPAVEDQMKPAIVAGHQNTELVKKTQSVLQGLIERRDSMSFGQEILCQRTL